MSYINTEDHNNVVNYNGNALNNVNANGVAANMLLQNDGFKTPVTDEEKSMPATSHRFNEEPMMHGLSSKEFISSR